jgi:RNA polymerase sigma-70 factor (ECF subfamily)
VRARARHPLPHDSEVELPAPTEDDDREASRSLSACVSLFVAGLPSPYREAVTLVELEGLTTREAAEMVGISVSGMKSRVQRGRAQLRVMFDRCCGHWGLLQFFARATSLSHIPLQAVTLPRP